MMQVLIILSSVSFFGFGFGCLFSRRLALEFGRYGLSQYRNLTGILQILAATGLLLGLTIPWIGGIAAAGLALQMACGLGVRVKIGDPWHLCLPAGFYMILCGYLATQML